MNQICTRCVMDTSAREIKFDQHGICNFCHSYEHYLAKIKASDIYNPEKLKEKISIMKDAGKDKKYDCIIGLSGGLDSSYLCHVMYEFGVRPLLIHVDNGWNSNLAEYNIRCITEKTQFDFERVTVDFDMFKELQKAYFRASVCDVEVLTDHAMMAILYQKAEEHGLQYSIIGSNYATEFIMPANWNYDKKDIVNIKDIVEKNSNASIDNFPFYVVFETVKKFIQIDPLNYEHYSKSKAIDILQKAYGWKPYPYKHYESIFTCFYQAYYLPVKFGIDKRRAHFSDLIHSKQMSRRDAIYELSKPACSGAALQQMKHTVLNKLGISTEEWENIMQAEPVPHTFYRTTADVLREANIIS